MDDKDMKMLIDQVKSKIDADFDVKKIEYMMDFGTVSVMVNMSYN